MALDEVGVKFVTEGESQFMSTMQRTVALGVAMGEALYNGAMKAAGAMIDFAKDSISAASDLNETTSKVGVVFDKEAEKVLAFGKTAATSLGMSENAALTAAGTYGNLFRSMGMASSKSADMSVNLVKLAGDLASFNNLDPTEVLEKLRSGLTGEAEPLKSLGININEVAIKEEAMRLGLMKGTKELTPAAKAQAVYSLMPKKPLAKA